jgi:hypothetical protein
MYVAKPSICLLHFNVNLTDFSANVQPTVFHQENHYTGIDWWRRKPTPNCSNGIKAGRLIPPVKENEKKER